VSDPGGKKGVEVDPVGAVLYSGNGEGTFVTAWKRRTEIGALKRAVSKSPLLRGLSAISKEAKDRFP